ncbi:MAG: hypothetical protein LJE84_01590 [Gammaproteobacteria bacterium]|nr:hypothetical protein [Gammaproteobacteria bacterium]
MKRHFAAGGVAGRALGVAFVTILLFLVVDLGYSRYLYDPRDYPELERARYRIQNPVYSHGFRANYCGTGVWGPRTYPICTNSLGYRDARARAVEKKPGRPRLLAVGDSFTEGIGVRYADSFVGRLAEARPDLEVLNSGVAGYSPIIYFFRVRELLEAGYRVDHVVVFPDISDIQDEARLYAEKDGRVVHTGHHYRKQLSNRRWRGYFKLSFRLIQLLRGEKKRPSFASQPAPALTRRGGWTYAADSNPKRRAEIEAAYQPLGIDAAIEKARYWMTRLYDMASARGIPVSVAVYPWAAQLVNDRVDNRQARIWREWCSSRCAYFIDGNPAFFSFRDENPADWESRLYISGDSHFNESGHELFAGTVAAAMRDWPAGRAD